MRKMTKERAKKYIDSYFREAIPVSLECQPQFWDAVMALCENPDANVVDIIDMTERGEYCIMDDGYFRRYAYIDKKANSVLEFAQHIAEQIRTIEDNDIDPLNYFILEKKVTELEEKVAFLWRRRRR